MKNLIINGSSKALQGEEEVKIVDEALTYNIELFSGKDEIWPDQCERAYSYLNDIKTLVQNLYEVFEQKSCHSVNITNTRSSGELIVMLYYVHAQLNKLQDLVAAFQPICRASSLRARKKRAEIISKLEVFMLHSDDIIQGIALFQQEDTLLESSNSYALVAQNALSLVSRESADQQNCQLAEALERTFDPTLREKLRSHLVLVTDGYVEERDAPKQRLVEEDQPVQAKTEQQEQESMLIGDTQALVNSTGDRSCAVTGSCKPSSKLEGEQQDRDDLSDERPFCG